MCQILQGPSKLVKALLLNTPGLLEDLHASNPDGFGVLYPTTSGPRIIKKLPRTAEDTRKIVKKLPDDDRPLAAHWRWRTHGLIDLENCHPYQVEGGAAIHNGVLNVVDTKGNPDRSDTWHFAREFLDGSMKALVNSPKLLDLVGEFIGGNRLVLMDDAGTMVLVNAYQGYVAQGVWIANEYAMDRSLVDLSYVKKAPSYGSWSGSRSYADDFDYEDEVGRFGHMDSGSYTGSGGEEYNQKATAEMWVEVIVEGDTDGAFSLLDGPNAAYNLRVLLTGLPVPRIDTESMGGMSDPYLKAAEYLVSGDIVALAAMCRDLREEVVAEVICYFSMWDGSSEEGSSEEGSSEGWPDDRDEGEDDLAEAHQGLLIKWEGHAEAHYAG